MAVKRKITPKENKLIKNYIRTGSLTKTGQLEGTHSSDNSGAVQIYKALNKGNVKVQIREELYRMGFDASSYAQFLINKTNAKKTLIASHMGQITDTLQVDDNTAQLVAGKMIAEVFDVYAKDQDKEDRDKALDKYLDKLQPEQLEKLLMICNTNEAEYEVVETL